MQNITIKIDEFDVERFRDLVAGKIESMDWKFPTNEMEEIEIKFVKSED